MTRGFVLKSSFSNFIMPTNLGPDSILPEKKNYTLHRVGVNKGPANHFDLLNLLDQSGHA